jgi:prevent-host-death family protein
MKPLRVGEARAAFGDLLDAAERGEPVIIRRRGVEFVLQPRKVAARAPRRPAVEWVDPSLADGQWTWVWGKTGVRPRSR